MVVGHIDPLIYIFKWSLSRVQCRVASLGCRRRKSQQFVLGKHYRIAALTQVRMCSSLITSNYYLHLVSERPGFKLGRAKDVTNGTLPNG